MVSVVNTNLDTGTHLTIIDLNARLLVDVNLKGMEIHKPESNVKLY